MFNSPRRSPNASPTEIDRLTQLVNALARRVQELELKVALHEEVRKQQDQATQAQKDDDKRVVPACGYGMFDV